MKKIYGTAIILFSFLFANGQTTENPWAVSLGANLVNLTGDNVESGLSFGAPSVGISRYLISGISLGGEYTVGNAVDGDTDYSYSALEGNLKFNIINDPDKTIRPFLKASYGLARFDSNDEKEGLFPSTESNYTLGGGVGLDIDLSDHVSVNLSSSILSNTENDSEFETAFNHMRHIVGFTYGFAMADKDRDGIRDRLDECPEQAGLKEFNGCPDSDGDGIPDKEDHCPNDAGVPEYNGCPDSDGDGIIDKEDRCPEKAGLAEFEGCPDTDQDGVPNPDDDCPTEAGPVENNGCPWGDSDGDGVNDNEDKCPDEVGTGPDGCIKIPQAIIDWTNSEKATLYFTGDSAELTDDVTQILSEELTPVLIEYTAIELLIEGHASEDGSDEYNYNLGLKRATAVKDFLVTQGVNSDSLEIVSYGETQTVGNQRTRLGRKLSRRVKIVLKE